MKNILIEVRDKIATYMSGGPIVCGNPFSITFDLDEEWAGHELLTARIVWADADGALTYVEKVFSGKTVEAPILSNVSQVYVGLYAAGLCTSTPALVPCRRSIQCMGGTTPDPAPDVYAQIIEMIQRGMLVGPPGPPGPKGDAGAIVFKPVTELPTENIDTSVIYLLPIADGGEENRFTEYVYINEKWEVLGAISIQIDHSEFAKKTDWATDEIGGVLRSVAAFGFRVDKYGRGNIVKAEKTDIDAATNEYKPIVPKMRDYFTMKSLSDCKDPTLWTDDSTVDGELVKGTKTKALELLGATKLYKHVMFFENNGIYAMIINSVSTKMTSEEIINAIYTGDSLKTRIRVDTTQGWQDVLYASDKTNEQIIVWFVSSGEITDDMLEVGDYDDTVTAL